MGRDVQDAVVGRENSAEVTEKILTQKRLALVATCV
jgi:hypothetical protein